MNDPGQELLEVCIALSRTGADFPTVWNEVLKRHRLVIGPPQSRVRGNEPIIEITLTTGQRIICGQHGYSIG